MNKKFIDPNIKNKSKTVEDRLQFIKYENKDLPLPTEIEISESGTCNRKCSLAIEHVPWPQNMFYGHRTCSMAIEHVLWQ